MLDVLIALGFLAVGVALGGWAWPQLAGRVLRHKREQAAAGKPARRILFPFVGSALSERALEASLRIARVEQATLVPAYLISVPMGLNLSAPMPRVCETAFELLEAIEQRALAAGVPVDSRLGRGRNLRHAMRELMRDERYDRVVVAAETDGTDGFSADDVAWLLRHADSEVTVVRPADDRALRARHRLPGPEEAGALPDVGVVSVGPR